MPEGEGIVEGIEGIEGIERIGDALVIRRRWAQSADLVALFGIALVDTVGLGLVFASGQILWGALAALFCALATYAVLARLINWTFVVVTREGIEVLSKPLPWYGARVIVVSQAQTLRQLVLPLKWSLGDLRRHAILVDTPQGPVRLFERDDVDASVSERVLVAIKATLAPVSAQIAGAANVGEVEPRTKPLKD